MRVSVILLTAGLIVAALVIGPGGIVAPMILVFFAALIFGLRGLSSRPGPARQRSSRTADSLLLAFVIFFALGASVWLVVGLLPGLARAVPSLHDSLHRGGGTSPAAHVEESLVAEDFRFDKRSITLTEGGSVFLRFTNLDGDAHNVAIYREGSIEDWGLDPRGRIFVGGLITGPQTVDYEFRVPEPGTYFFICEPHPDMWGTVEVTAPSPAPIEPTLPGPLASLSRGVAEATHSSQSAGPMSLQYLFSLVNLGMALLLIRLRPFDRAAQFLAIGMLGTAATFNEQAHTSLTILPFLSGSIHDSAHILAGVSYVVALFLFPDSRLPRWAEADREGRSRVSRMGYLLLWMVLGFVALTTSGGMHFAANDFVIFFGVLIPVAGIVSQSFRFRAETVPERRREHRALVWAFVLALGVALVAATLSVATDAFGTRVGRVLGDLRQIAFVVFPLVFALIPLTLFLVMVRYRVWDIDRAINRALTYGILLGLIGIVYVTAVVGIGQVIGSAGQYDLAVSLAVTAGVAVGFGPLKEKVEDLANRLVYGERFTPYEVITHFAQRMSGVLAVQDVLPRMAEAAARGVGADRSQVTLFLPDGSERSFTWPEDASDEEGGWRRTVLHQAEAVGEVVVAKGSGDSLRPHEEELLEDLVSEAGLVMKNLRLTEELKARLEELSASRERIVAAQDEERRRVERDIHDGAQQQLVSLKMNMGMVERLLESDPQAARGSLVALREELDSAIESLRDLARGVFPPLLEENGLVSAVRSHVAKMRLNARVDSDSAEGKRFDRRVERAVYFTIREALQNASKHAEDAEVTISIFSDDSYLSFEVRDRGPGFDPSQVPRGSGLQNMADRIEAIGGVFDIESEVGRGTRVQGKVPV